MPTTTSFASTSFAAVATAPTVATGAAPRVAQVGMGEIDVGKGPNKLSSVLGSCVGLALIHPRCKAGALAHVVLPDSTGRTGPPGKFADTAVPKMVHLLAENGVPPAGLVAKLTGGANMFASTGPLQIGDQNIEALRAILKKQGIPVVAEHVGGNKGRRVTLDCGTGELIVEVAGSPQAAL